MLRRILLLGLTVLALTARALPLLAQEPTLNISMRRDWGYGGFAGDIQGTFTIKVEGPADLAAVQFFIDDRQIGEATEPPFSLQFKTDDYPLGVHEISARGQTASGAELTSDVLVREFVAAQQGQSTALKIIIPIVLVALLASVGPYLIYRLRGGEKRTGSFGPLGGAVCPRCGYPYPRHVWGLNLGAGKYDRCPNCGKWSVVRRASSEELLAAARRHGLQAGPEAPADEPGRDGAERLRRQLEESRFEEEL